MTTIKNILHSWLVSRQDYTQGVDIFRRVSKDASLISYFCRFASDYTASRLRQEMEKLYLELKTETDSPIKFLEVSDLMKKKLCTWLDFDESYFEGVGILVSLTGDASLDIFFSNHISEYSKRLLHKELKSNYEELESAAAAQNKKPAGDITMVDHLKAWFNGDRNYGKGIDIFCTLTNSSTRGSFFRNNDNDATHKELYQELDKLYNQLTSKGTSGQNTIAAMAQHDGPSQTVSLR